MKVKTGTETQVEKVIDASRKNIAILEEMKELRKKIEESEDKLLEMEEEISENKLEILKKLQATSFTKSAYYLTAHDQEVVMLFKNITDLSDITDLDCYIKLMDLIDAVQKGKLTIN